jgi:fatty-acyl-CoA synthase
VTAAPRSVVTSADFADRITDIDPEIALVIDGDLDGWERYEDVGRRAAPTPLADEPEGQGMFYSSGTTGRPKGHPVPAARSDRSTTSTRSVQYASPITNRGDDVYLSPRAALPHRSGGLLVDGPPRGRHRWWCSSGWDPTACSRRSSATASPTAQFVPTMFVRLLKLPPEVRARYDVSSLRLVSHAAAPCPVEVKRQVIEWLGPIVWEYYAGSENVGSTMVGPTSGSSTPARSGSRG